MLCKLWVAQDLFAELQAISVLLVLITSLQQKTEQILQRVSEASIIPFSTDPQEFRLKWTKGHYWMSAECKHCFPVTSTNNWSFLLRTSTASHTLIIASLTGQSAWDFGTKINEENSTTEKNLDDGGLWMRFNQTSGQMDVPGSEQTPGAQNTTTPLPFQLPLTL